MSKNILYISIVAIFIGCSMTVEDNIPISAANAVDLIICQEEKSAAPIDTLDMSDYPGIKSKAISERNKLLKEFKTTEEMDQVLLKAGASIEQLLVEEIIPYWYGTKWEFSGHTDIPNEGEIACGYFVSTTLKHIGFNLNRYKFAQQASYHEAKSLMFGKEPKMLRPKSIEETHKLLSDEKPGLYMVGLDNHVGFLLIKKDEILFIHSDYVSLEVKNENILDSPAFRSNVYCLAPITNNSELCKHWLENEKLTIVMTY